MNISELKEIFKKIWCRETSAYPDIWTEENPSCGQCLSTARIIQNLFGGEIVFAIFGREIHFWNLLPDGSEEDLTSSQFPADFVLSAGRVISRGVLDAYGVLFPEVSKRYRLLAMKFLLR